MTNYNELYKKHKREYAEPGVIAFDKFKLDGEATCSAWAGNGGYEKMVCKFLRTFHFGTRFECAYSGDELMDLKPNENCPLWGAVK